MFFLIAEPNERFSFKGLSERLLLASIYTSFTWSLVSSMKSTPITGSSLSENSLYSSISPSSYLKVLTLFISAAGYNQILSGVLRVLKFSNCNSKNFIFMNLLNVIQKEIFWVKDPYVSSCITSENKVFIVNFDDLKDTNLAKIVACIFIGFVNSFEMRIFIT